MPDIRLENQTFQAIVHKKEYSALSHPSPSHNGQLQNRHIPPHQQGRFPPQPGHRSSTHTAGEGTSPREQHQSEQLMFYALLQLLILQTCLREAVSAHVPLSTKCCAKQD